MQTHPVTYLIDRPMTPRDFYWFTCQCNHYWMMYTSRVMWGETPIGVKRTPRFSRIWILVITYDYCGNGYLKFNIYEWHGNAANLFTYFNRILGQYTWYNFRNLRAMFWNMALSIMGWDAHGRITPRYSIAIPHNKLQCTYWNWHIYA